MAGCCVLRQRVGERHLFSSDVGDAVRTCWLIGFLFDCLNVAVAANTYTHIHINMFMWVCTFFAVHLILLCFDFGFSRQSGVIFFHFAPMIAVCLRLGSNWAPFIYVQMAMFTSISLLLLPLDVASGCCCCCCCEKQSSKAEMNGKAIDRDFKIEWFALEQVQPLLGTCSLWVRLPFKLCQCLFSYSCWLFLAPLSIALCVGNRNCFLFDSECSSYQYQLVVLCSAGQVRAASSTGWWVAL